MSNFSSSSVWSASSSLLLLCEESAGTRISLSLIYSLLALVGTLSNVMVIYLVFSFRKLQTTSNAFIVNGCVADLSVCALWMPQEAVLGLLPANSSSSHSAEYRLLRGGLLGLGLTVSLLSHLLVALNRYVLITKAPSTYQALYQQRRTGWMIGLSWGLALVLVLLLPGLWTQWLSQQSSQQEISSASSSSHYTALLLALAMLSQTVLLLHCYLGIMRRVRVSVKRVSVLNFHLLHQLPFPAAPLPARRVQRRLSSISVLLLCCVFLLDTQPVVWVSLLGFFLQSVPQALQVTSWLLFCSLSAFNPLLYTWKNEEFRRSVRSVLPRGETPAVTVAAAAAAAALPTVSLPCQEQPRLGTKVESLGNLVLQ
ncbi:probable G-protein coupled receptor 88 [Malaclemys terrapin pileata]|uniref:probable G-protein coupled receptor 88 n=1 Tax=Malaclemys terrapin pileata TaxID=2991368 RepID=UPI0023A812A1|nr:probable G-protein coupled receptor 88 [Malaclemys terrapin pileata]